MLATFYFKNLSANIFIYIYLAFILKEANYGAQYYYFFWDYIYPTKWLPKNFTNFKTKEIKLFIVEYK